VVKGSPFDTPFDAPFSIIAENTTGADEHISPSRKTVFTDFFFKVSPKAFTCGD
jgi:hypothetical protein